MPYHDVPLFDRFASGSGVGLNETNSSSGPFRGNIGGMRVLK
jgi:hypothetical protein